MGYGVVVFLNKIIGDNRKWVSVELWCGRKRMWYIRERRWCGVKIECCKYVINVYSLRER